MPAGIPAGRRPNPSGASARVGQCSEAVSVCKMNGGGGAKDGSLWSVVRDDYCKCVKESVKLQTKVVADDAYFHWERGSGSINF